VGYIRYNTHIFRCEVDFTPNKRCETKPTWR